MISDSHDRRVFKLSNTLFNIRFNFMGVAYRTFSEVEENTILREPLNRLNSTILNIEEATKNKLDSTIEVLYKI
jgi:hypothetical protein